MSRTMKPTIASARAVAEAMNARHPQDVFPRPKGCQCDREVGDSDCPVHPSCAECGEYYRDADDAEACCAPEDDSDDDE